VRGLEEFQAAILHEGNLPARQLDLEQIAVAGTAEQHGLTTQASTRLTPLQYLHGHVLGL
jgi:hypothetical protein